MNAHVFSSPAAVRRPSLSAQIQRVRAKCGVEAWLVADHARPLVSLAFALRLDTSRLTNKDAAGVELMSNLLGEGAGGLDATAFQLALDESAIELSVTARRDHVRGDMRMLRSRLGRAFELLGKALREPECAAASIDRIRAEMVANYAMATAQPSALAEDAYAEAAYAPHLYGTTIAARLAALETVDRGAVLDLHRSLLSRANLVIAVAGAISAEDLANHLDDIFGSVPAGQRAVEAPVPFKGAGTEVARPIDAPHSCVVFGRPAIPVDDPDMPSANVVSHCFGSGITSRLMTELRERQGLCYNVGMSLDVASGLCALKGSTSTPNETAADAIASIKREIGRLLEGGLTAEEIAMSKGYLVGASMMQWNETGQIASMLLDTQLRGRQTEWLDQRLDRIEEVTVDSVQRVLPRLFGDGTLLWSIAGGRT